MTTTHEATLNAVLDLAADWGYSNPTVLGLSEPVGSCPSRHELRYEYRHCSHTLATAETPEALLAKLQTIGPRQECTCGSYDDCCPACWALTQD